VPALSSATQSERFTSRGIYTSVETVYTRGRHTHLSKPITVVVVIEIIYILNKMTGTPNPHISPGSEDKFKETQVPFLK
jgi:hypothetical protein